MKPFPPSWQDDADMLSFIAGLAQGGYTMTVYDDPKADRLDPGVPHHCVEFRGKMYVVISHADFNAEITRRAHARPTGGF